MATTATTMPMAAHWPLLRPLDVEPGDEGSGWEDEEDEVLVTVDGATPLDAEPGDEGSGRGEEEDEVLVAVDGATPLPGVAVGPACVS